ncbi:zinc finger and SCAN domain-containing protein 16-like [Sphaerodactylus townsendi]|uniref:zinc finger and SCAN domain-containing protein 16-like n=1 Tax=Sphaerodactylus townsendi TaxID=933632 RepID=UPI0020268E9D|nr:zinc finger and SCAN domain-containing protein 16-like [Sphaerodactylus townsendi]
MEVRFQSAGAVQGKESALWDDAKAFLASFEQVAEACQWPKEEWAARLLPALSGEAQKAFCSIEARDREDYGKVRAAILCREANCTETLRQRFRQFRPQEVEDPHWIYRQLQELCYQWLRPERHSKEQILELLILEQFLAILPPKLQSWIRAGGPENCVQAVTMMDYSLRCQQEAETQPCQTPLDLKEETMSLEEAVRTMPKASPRCMCWEVVEESCEETNSLGGLLVLKPEVFSELEQEETQYMPACDDGIAIPDVDVLIYTEGGRILSENENEIYPQGCSERRELPKSLPGYSQSCASLRPKGYKTGSNLAQLQRSHQGKGQEKPSRIDEGITKGITRSLRERNHMFPEYRHKTSLSADLIRHTSINAGDGSYQCCKCGKIFKSMSALNGHQRVHAYKPSLRGKGQSFCCAPLSERQRMLPDGEKLNKRGKKTPQKESNEPQEVNSTLADVFQNMLPEITVILEPECELNGHTEKGSIKNQNDSIKLAEHNSSAADDTRNVWIRSEQAISFSPSRKAISLSKALNVDTWIWLKENGLPKFTSG